MVSAIWRGFVVGVGVCGMLAAVSSVGLLVFAGCSGQQGRVHAADAEAADEGLGDAALPDLDGAPGDLGADPTDAEATETYVGPPCPAGHVTCYRGVRAVCAQDGRSWALSPCPAGQVCEGDACVANPVQVALVVNPSSVGLGGGGESVPPEVLQAALDDACAENPSCCSSSLDEALDAPWASFPLLAKYWARKVLQGLAEVPNSYVYLLGPPQSEAPDDAACSSMVASPSVLRTCLEGSTHLMGGTEFNQRVSLLAGVEDYFASGGTTGPASEFAPLNPEDVPSPWQADSAWRDLLVTAEGVAGDVLTWVNYRAEPGDPEMEVFNRALPPPASWRAHAVLSLLSQEVGRPCQESADCPRAGQVCNAHDRCEDPASACRVRDVVLVSSFGRPMFPAAPPSEDVTECGYHADVDQPVWGKWLRWGCACGKSERCPVGAVCDTSCGRFQDRGACPGQCQSTAILDRLGSPPTWGSLGTSGEWVVVDCDLFPSPRPVDAIGRPWLARVHSILLHTCDLYSDATFEAGHVKATATALLGDGVAVTPCPPSVPGMFDPEGFLERNPVASCDWQERFEALITAIAEDGQSVCSLEKAGVPSSLPAGALVF